MFASDASGTPQLYRHDFKANKIRQMTEAAALNTNLFQWSAGDKGVVFLDGASYCRPAPGGTGCCMSSRGSGRKAHGWR